MILGMEIGMLLAGLWALATGKFQLTRRQVYQGAAARIAGVVLMAPIPLAFAVLVFLQVWGRGRSPLEGRFAAALVELGCCLVCLLGGLLVARLGQQRRPPPPDPLIDDHDILVVYPVSSASPTAVTACDVHRVGTPVPLRPVPPVVDAPAAPPQIPPRAAAPVPVVAPAATPTSVVSPAVDAEPRDARVPLWLSLLVGSGLGAVVFLIATAVLLLFSTVGSNSVALAPTAPDEPPAAPPPPEPPKETKVSPAPAPPRIGVNDYRDLGRINAHVRPIVQMAVSPDGQYLATAPNARRPETAKPEPIRIWRLEDRKEAASTPGLDPVEFTPDGKYLVARVKNGPGVELGLADFSKLLRGEPEGFLVGKVPVPDDGFQGKAIYALDPTTPTAAVWGKDKHFEKFELATLRRLQSMPNAPANPPAGMVWSPAGNQVALLDGSPGAAVCWAHDGAVRFRLVGHTGRVNAVAYAPASDGLATASQDGTIRLWDAGSGEARGVLKGHRAEAAGVAFSPDGKWLASIGLDGAVRLWDRATQAEALCLFVSEDARWAAEAAAPLVPPADAVPSVLFAPTGKMLIASWGGDVRLWDVSKVVKPAQAPIAAARTVAPTTPTFLRPDAPPAERNLVVARPQRVLMLPSPDYVTQILHEPEGRGSLVLSGATLHRIDLKTGTPQGQPTELFPFGPISSLSRAADGNIFLAGAVDGGVKLWNQTGEVVRRFSREEEGLGYGPAAVSPDGSLLVAGGRNLMVWEAATGKELRKTPEWVQYLAFSPDGRLLATAGSDVVHLSNPTTGERVRSLKVPKAGVFGLAFSPDGRFLVVAHREILRVFDVATGEERAALAGHTRPVTRLAVSPDGRLLLSAVSPLNVVGKDRQNAEFFLWDLETKTQIAALAHNPPSVSYVGFTADGKEAVTAGSDRLIAFWGPLPQPVAGNAPFGPVRALPAAVVIPPPEETLVIRPRQSFPCHLYFGSQPLLFDPEGRKVSVPTATGLSWRDVGTGDEVGPEAFRRLNRVTASVSRSADGKRLAISDNTADIRVWDFETGAEVKKFRGGDPSSRLALSPDGKTLAAGHLTLYLWNVETGQEIPLSHRFPGFVNCLAFSPNGKVLAGGHSDDCVRLFDLEGKVLRRLEGHRGGVRCLAFSPDGTQLATGSADRTIKIWEVETGKELATLSGLESEVAGVAFAPDGKRLLSGLSSTISRLKAAPYAYVWDLGTGRRVATLVGHTHGVGCVAWSPDGKTAATLGHDANVRLWDLDPLLNPKPPEKP